VCSQSRNTYTYTTYTNTESTCSRLKKKKKRRQRSSVCVCMCACRGMMPPSCQRLHATPHIFPKEPYTLSKKALDIFKRALHTGWRRLIGCLTLQVIFRKRATNYRALSQKISYKDKASYDPTPPRTFKRDLHLWPIAGRI